MGTTCYGCTARAPWRGSMKSAYCCWSMSELASTTRHGLDDHPFCRIRHRGLTGSQPLETQEMLDNLPFAMYATYMYEMRVRVIGAQ